MKKITILLLLFLMASISFSLEITNIDPLNFGVVVKGDKSISLMDVGVDVEGKAGRQVEIVVPETYNLEGNTMLIKPKQRRIILDGNGMGEFKLDIKLRLENLTEYRTLTDNLTIKVRYVE